jgi:AcrR family transcriptional regulator
MAASKEATRRAARRIGVDQGANFDQRREIILREAARTFNEKGVQNTSIDDIARRLNVSKPALYHYVSSKDKMLRLCMSMALANYDKMLTKAEALDGTGLDRLRCLFGLWAADAVTDFGRAIVLIDSNALTPESRKSHLEANRIILHRIEGLVKEGVNDRSISQCNSAVTTLTLLGMFNSPAKWFRADGALSLDETVAEMIKMMEKALAPK